MTPREAELLLGGYATGILTDQERKALFDSALGNQALFDALADEEALRDLLADPGARAELLRAVTADTHDERWGSVAATARPGLMGRAPASAAPPTPAPVPLAKPSFWARLFQPAPLAGVGALAVAVIGLFSLRPTEKPQPVAQSRPVLQDMARARQAAPPEASPPPPPLPAPPPRLASPPPSPVQPVRQQEVPGQAAIPPRVQEAEPSPPQKVAIEQRRAVGGAATSSRDERDAQAPRADGAALPRLPFRVEVRNTDGSFVASGPVFRAGATVRVVVDAPSAGRLVVRDGDTVLFNAEVGAGQRVAIPVASVGNRRGTRSLRITLAPGFESPTVATLHFR
jgi:hypothetical protein